MPSTSVKPALLRLADEHNAVTATVVLDQTSVGRLSRMDAMQQQALRRIEAALRRCDEGSYGECQIAAS